MKIENKVLFYLILVLGLLSGGCDQFSDKKKVEKCADQEAINYGIVLSDKNAILWKGDFADNPDPLDLFKAKIPERLLKLDLKDKLKNKRYEKIWDYCEKEFQTKPIKFKEMYLK